MHLGKPLEVRCGQNAVYSLEKFVLFCVFFPSRALLGFFFFHLITRILTLKGLGDITTPPHWGTAFGLGMHAHKHTLLLLLHTTITIITTTTLYRSYSLHRRCSFSWAKKLIRDKEDSWQAPFSSMSLLLPSLCRLYYSTLIYRSNCSSNEWGRRKGRKDRIEQDWIVMDSR
ncbi:hypothetical protein F4775DRAFT_290082 [Biscogniauxia sp. FL1348]|nr:hypothetical protein F4775DRAFT_290082 [Biscogniauxia sp. FL1348]